MRATSLNIQVVDQGTTRVHLTFAAAVAANLPALIPPAVQPRLEARGIDVARIAAQAVADGFRTAELFVLEETSRTLRVWLE